MDRLAARAVPLFVLAGIGFADGFDLNRTANLETGSVVGKALRPDVDGRPGAAFVKVSGSGTNLARVGDTDGAFVVGGLPGGRLDLRLFDDVDGDGELLDELDAGHHQLVPPTNGPLHAVPDLAVTVLGQPVQSERAPGSVPTEALEASSIVFVQVRPAVQGEAVEERLESSSWPGVDRLTTPLERLRSLSPKEKARRLAAAQGISVREAYARVQAAQHVDGTGEIKRALEHLAETAQSLLAADDLARAARQLPNDESAAAGRDIVGADPC